MTTDELISLADEIKKGMTKNFLADARNLDCFLVNLQVPERLDRASYPETMIFHKVIYRNC